MSSSAFTEGGAALVKLARSITAATSLDELDRAFTAQCGRLLTSPMYGFWVSDADGRKIERNVGVNVSDVFVARYIRSMEVDPLLARSQESGQAVYNLDLMPEDEWLESAVYRDAYAFHEMRHVVEAPITDGPVVLGALHFAACDPTRNYTASDLQMADTVAGLLAISLASIRREDARERALEHALAALELTGTALVTSDDGDPELKLNAAARTLLSEVVDGERHLPQLLVPHQGGGRFSRRTEVELRTGQTASLHAHTQPVRHGTLATVLELKRDHPRLDPRQLASLTPRESEVAVLVVEGLSDPEIGRELCISRYTVQQYVKRIYRALDVDSRVALTRLLLGAPVGARRG